MPIAVPTVPLSDAQYCAEQCLAAGPSCKGFNYVSDNSCLSLPCAFPSGCCWLKLNASSARSAPNSACASTACSFVVRPDMPPTPTLPPPPLKSKSVLYIIVDDMRPNAGPWGMEELLHTPNLNKLAGSPSAVTFTAAHCNIAVCSPSRNSFLSGRYPTNTLVWNFINHIRQNITEEVVDASFAAGPASMTFDDIYFGGAGQCATLCASSGSCAAWELRPSGACVLYDAALPSPARAPGSISGLRAVASGARAFVTLPQYLTAAGFWTGSSGKVFHTEEGGIGPAPWDGPGSGMPPLQDPPSWSSAERSMSNVNAFAPMRPCEATCSINGSLEGDVGPRTFRFCDKIIGDDALAKMRAAAASGGPFLLAVGFRKPHLPFRHPDAYDALYPPPSAIPLAAHQLMDASIPPVAYHYTSGLSYNPYVALPTTQQAQLRRDYYASISWTDHQIGRLLDELDALGLANDTAVVFHADHGWSLGESAAWEKFTLWEAGTRVPLIVRAPFLAPGRPAARSGEIVQLVDIFPTVAALVGLPVGPQLQLDGESLLPALQRALAAPSAPGAPPPAARFALSVYPRCPADLRNASLFWKNNDCLLTERTRFAIMGISLRLPDWRYTEWRWWDGQALMPDWARAPVGVELYNHTGDDGSTPAAFDDFEVRNLAGDPGVAALQAQFAAQLRSVYPAGSAWPSQGSRRD